VPWKLFVFMLVILNPFAQVVYLQDLMTSLTVRDFAGMHLRATLLSFGVFVLFAFVGDLLLSDVFHVQLAALQIFGGLIILYIAYRYFANGAGSNLLFRGDIGDLASEVSLPYMVGPGTLWISILIGRRVDWLTALLAIGGVLAINMIFVILVRIVFERLYARRNTMLGKYFSILMRTNTLFIGAIAVQMILTGIGDVFHGLTGSQSALPPDGIYR
jgi:small neutral amino acid transporter SnatA (MarC family)